jgi:hypothetical protein
MGVGDGSGQGFDLGTTTHSTACHPVYRAHMVLRTPCVTPDHFKVRSAALWGGFPLRASDRTFSHRNVTAALCTQQRIAAHVGDALPGVPRPTSSPALWANLGGGRPPAASGFQPVQRAANFWAGRGACRIISRGTVGVRLIPQNFGTQDMTTRRPTMEG